MEHHYLYVEDDPFSREIMRIIIENGVRSQNLTIFEDSINFMARLEALPHLPTIILLDIQVMPHDALPCWRCSVPMRVMPHVKLWH